MRNDVFAAVRELERGGVVALPTETVYGLAANALDEVAVGKIFEVKRRPLLNPLILHIFDDSWVERYADTADCAARLWKIINSFWPGPITAIVKKKAIIPAIVTAGSGSVAIRCPNHELFREVLRICDFPLAAPSANPFGYVSPTTAEQVKQTLGDGIKVIVDGGPCSVGLESTILDMTQSVPKILRPGAITADAISSALGEKIADYEPIVANNPTASGQLKRHYCTHTKLVLFPHGNRKPATKASGKIAAVLNGKPVSPGEIAENFHTALENIFWLSEDGDAHAIARNLFAMLQRLDGGGYGIIFCERPLRMGIGIATDDRLLRAAAKFND
ncbi:MAG: threonylcarbamoyl-AMP synthase [Puniceicoccales bacterium]|nr:threonylcarbamoyl-AMP synthase [Puniceicoccales bacterium]